MTPSNETRTVAAERLSGRLLIGFTYVAVGFLIGGVLGMALAGISPVTGGSSVDVMDIVAALAAFDPAALLLVGIVAVIAAPLARVIVAGLAYASDSDWRMVAVSIAILAIIAIGVVSALAATV